MRGGQERRCVTRREWQSFVGVEVDDVITIVTYMYVGGEEEGF